MDETFVGGQQRQALEAVRENKKEVVIGIKQRGGELRFFKAEDMKSGTLAKYIKENISEDVDVIMTDEWAAYPGRLMGAGYPSERSTRR